jgi:hypothetical protein
MLLHTSAQISDVCRQTLALAPRDYPPDLPMSELLLGAPAWYDFEHQAWERGELVRQSLAAAPRLRRNEEVHQSLLAVVEYPNLRRGRQPFAHNLGCVAAAPHAVRLVPYLRDPDIAGQVLAALLKMKAAGYVSEVEPLALSKYAWIRNLAKTYLARYRATQPN